MTKHYCDMCGNEIPTNTKRKGFEIRVYKYEKDKYVDKYRDAERWYETGRDVDICVDCCKRLLKIFDAEVYGE